MMNCAATSPMAMLSSLLGVAALGAEAVARIVKTVSVYDDFCHANDPYVKSTISARWKSMTR